MPVANADPVPAMVVPKEALRPQRTTFSINPPTWSTFGQIYPT